MAKNLTFTSSDTSYLIDNENFVSDKYLDFYENDWYGWLERVSLWIGNNIFSSNHDLTYMYKTMLMDYLDDMVTESREVNEIRQLVGTTHKILSNMNSNIETIIEKGTANEKAELDLLKEKLNGHQKELNKMLDGGMASGMTKDDFYKKWDDILGDYRDTKSKVTKLDGQIKFNEKILNKTEVFGVVFDIADIAITGYDVYDKYNTFTSSMAEMEGCLSVLEEIMNSSEAPSELQTVASELHKAIEDQQLDFIDTFCDVVFKVGGKGLDIASTLVYAKIPVVGKYLVAIKAALGIGDFVLNISDVSEACTCLYAIAKSSTIMASKFKSDISNTVDYNGWKNLYTKYDVAADDYFALAIMRKTSEEQMKAADEANSWIIEWLFTEFMYKVDDIDANIEKIDQIKKKYIAAAACN